MSTIGVCVFCKNTYTGRGMSRHLEACKARQAALAGQRGPKTKLFHLVAKGTYSPAYWLHLEIPAAATLLDLDRFLRDIWLECCGHLSMFRIGDQSFHAVLFEDYWDGESDMAFELGQVLEPGLKFSHEYDFGSTTYLTLRVVSAWEGRLNEAEPIQVLARNNAPEFECEECGEPATVVCVFCDYTVLCEDCIETHECGEEGLLPLVNSPRVGVCGYTGDAW